MLKAIKQKIYNILRSLFLRFRLDKLINSPSFDALYGGVCAAVLFASALLSAVLGASLQQSNADQLANTYLFADQATRLGATFPGQHTFLLKWPIFDFMRLFGSSANSFIAMTTFVVLLTVGILAFIMYKIERRPLVFGTLCLALASVLLLIPIQPYAGALLPVSMSMITTRNIEYIFYIFSVILLLKTSRIKSRYFYLATGLLSLLIASDKLFLTLSLGAAMLALVVYAFMSRWQEVSSAVRWLISTIIAALIAMLIIVVINASGFTNISSQSGVGPYSIVSSIKQLTLGLFYAATGVITNLGANPAYDALTVASIPNLLRQRVLSTAFIAWLVNGAVLILGVAAISYYTWYSLFKRRTEDLPTDLPVKLTLALSWTTIAAIAAFSLSDHYYPVDARYVSIVLFAVFIALASAVRGRKWRRSRIVILGAIIFTGVVLAVPMTIQNFDEGKAALRGTDNRNARIAEVIDNHKVDFLLGDYWRVLPIKSLAPNTANIMPLGACTEPRDVLSSKHWQPDLTKHSFAYILTYDKSLTGYKPCTLDQIIKVYGRPNSSTLIDGTISHPYELLLFYDRGALASAPSVGGNTSTPATIVPVSLDELPHKTCSQATTLNIVAHEDDDLIFMNPDVSKDIKSGRCVRTVYVTAGDAGSRSQYWLGRERGSEAAYSHMLGINDIWIERVVKISEEQFIIVANPRGNNKITLVFMRLPDGNLRGNGFGHSRFESLQSLETSGNKIHTVDGQSSYTAKDLTTTMTSLMRVFEPAEIRTQSSITSNKSLDHSDHVAVSHFVKQAHKDYEQQKFDNQVVIPIKFYIGYPVRDYPENVFGAERTEKYDAFFEYGKLDGAVCHTYESCNKSAVYGEYLNRQYKSSY